MPVSKSHKYHRHFFKEFRSLTPQSPTYVKNTREIRHRQTIDAQTGTGVDESPQAIGNEGIAGQTLWEICRKISYVISTPDEIYELPPGWDGTDSSPTWPSGFPDPTEAWMQVPRVHEIVYIDEATKNIVREKFHNPEEEGPTGAFSATLSVLVTAVDDHVPSDSRIPSSLLTSPEAQAAITQAQGEV